MKTKQGLKAHEAIQLPGLRVEVMRKRVKNVNLRIRPDGTAVVSAPAQVPLGEIERFVSGKRDWILRHIDTVTARSTSRSYGEGAVVPLWGEPHTVELRCAPSRARETATVSGAAIIISTVPREREDDERARRGQLVDALERRELAERIERLLPDCQRRVGRRCSRIRIRRMTSRWGSCNVKTGSITINLELAERPPACLEYVLVHELCHLIEPNHGPRFHALMDWHFPAWREVRSLLRESPPRRTS